MRIFINKVAAQEAMHTYGQVNCENPIDKYPEGVYYTTKQIPHRGIMHA